MTASELTVPGMLRARRGLDKVLLVCDEQRLTYADADTRSSALATHLINLGVGSSSHVGLLLPNGADFVVAMLAVARIGAVVVPFSTFSTATELRTQLADSDVAVLLATPAFRNHDYVRRLQDALPGAPLGGELILDPDVPALRHIVIGTERSSECDPLLPAREDEVAGSDVLAIIYTSGSTSTPKGVVHTHEALLAHQRSLNAIRRFGAEDRLFCNSPFFWIGGFAFGLLATLVAGATLVCSNATDAADTLDLLEAEKPTLTNGFVAGIAHLARHPSFPGRDLSSLRRGNLYPIMAPESRPADPELRHNMLGLTEAGSVLLISDDESDQPEARRGSYGRPAPGFETRVVDPGSGCDAGTGVGELLIRGPYLMQGYHGRAREDCFDADGWFHTGDLVRRDEDDFFYFVGRAGAMIKTAGANVAPAEVERALAAVCQQAGIDATAHVVGLPDPERGQTVAAVIATGSTEPPSAAWLRDALRSRLSSYKIPRHFRTVRPTDLPMLSSGKVDLTALGRLFDA